MRMKTVTERARCMDTHIYREKVRQCASAKDGKSEGEKEEGDDKTASARDKACERVGARKSAREK